MSDEAPKKRKRANAHDIAEQQTGDYLASLRDSTGIVIVVRSWNPGGDKSDEISIKSTNGIPRSACAAVLWQAAMKLDPDIAKLFDSDDEQAESEIDDDELED